MKHFIKKTGLISSLLLTLVSSIALADSELENTTLARIKNVLNSLTPLIHDAEHQQDANARTQFHYAWLREDLNKIIHGINEKLNLSKLEPRNIQPIKGDYLMRKSSSQ